MKKYLEIVRKYFSDKKIIEMFENQIEYYELEKNNTINYAKKNIGDEVILKKGTLIHGTRIHIEKLNLIKEKGIIAPEFFKDVNLNKKKPWVVEFWKINENIKLKDYINKYCGCTIEIKNRDGSILKNIISSFCDIENNIKSIKNIEYRDYLIYQNMEQRFLPNDYTNNSTMAFIINSSNENQKRIIENNLLDRDGNIDIQKQLFASWFIKKYFDTKTFDNNETNRGVAYLFGIPSNMIEGILVNRNIEKSQDALDKIKKIFFNCYICNIDGLVIK